MYQPYCNKNIYKYLLNHLTPYAMKFTISRRKIPKMKIQQKKIVIGLKHDFANKKI